jgi:hypothetical protein
VLVGFTRNVVFSFSGNQVLRNFLLYPVAHEVKKITGKKPGYFLIDLDGGLMGVLPPDTG